jgi:hypothetical protein
MKLLKTMVLSILLAAAAIPPAQAQRTNVVQNLSVQLWGVKPGGSVTNQNNIANGIASATINNRQVVQALGVATVNRFSNAAKLVIVTPLIGGVSAVQVRDGNNKVDVSQFFQHDQTSGLVAGSSTSTRAHRTVNLAYSIQRFALVDAAGYPALNLHFDLSGFATESSTNSTGVDNLQINAAGSGDALGVLLILSGDIEVIGGYQEVVAVAQNN